MKASDNPYPSILITEGTEPTAPAAGKQRLYIDSTTHKLKRTDSSGTDVTIEGGGTTRTYSTSLPGSPAEGDEWLYPVGSGVLWLFRYNASGSTYKWEFMGGSPLHNDVQVGQTIETTTSTTFAALTTAGPVVVLPRAGEYMVGLGFSGGDSAVFSEMSYDIGGTGAVTADAVRQQNAGTATSVTSVARHRAQTFASAVTLTCKYRSSTAGTAAFAARWLDVLPIRIA